jgi:hypothetical protein
LQKRIIIRVHALQRMFGGKRPLHVVAADHPEANEIIVITVYEPDPVQYVAEEVSSRILQVAEKAVREGARVDVRQYLPA